MDIKEEEDPLSDDVVPQKDIAVNTLLLDDDDECHMPIKVEIKCEADSCLQEEEELEHETVTCNMNNKTEEILIPDFVQEIHKFKTGNKIEIKEEYCWQETEASSVGDEIKDEDFASSIFPRSCIEAVYGDKSPLPSNEDLRKDVGLYMEKDSPGQGSYIHSEHATKYKNGDNKASYCKQMNMIPEVKRSHQCEFCQKRFTHLSLLKMHNLIHENIKPHKCEICEKRFNRLSNLKRHNLIHEGKKEHKCAICEKRFTHSSSLKLHNLIHEGKKPHKCKICEKRFTGLSDLKRHHLIHEGKRPHKCTICDQTFTRMSNLKRHNLIHEAKKSEKC